jgi:hypothetical protein
VRASWRPDPQTPLAFPPTPTQPRPAGQASITGSCAVITSYGAVIIGAIGGLVYTLCSRLFKKASSALRLNECVHQAFSFTFLLSCRVAAGFATRLAAQGSLLAPCFACLPACLCCLYWSAGAHQKTTYCRLTAAAALPA